MRFSFSCLNVWLILTLLSVLVKLSGWDRGWVWHLLPAWGPICVGVLYSLFGNRRQR